MIISKRSLVLDGILIHVFVFCRGIDTKSLFPILGIKNDCVAAVLFDMTGVDHLAHQLSRCLVSLGRHFSISNARSEFCQFNKLGSLILLFEHGLFLVSLDLSNRSSSLCAHLQHVGPLTL